MSMFHHRAKRDPTQMCYWSSLHILVILHIHALHTCTQRDLGIKSKGTLHEIVTISIIKSRYQRFFHKSNYKYLDTDLTLQFGQTPGNSACSYARPLGRWWTIIGVASAQSSSVTVHQKGKWKQNWVLFVNETQLETKNGRTCVFPRG